MGESESLTPISKVVTVGQQGPAFHVTLLMADLGDSTCSEWEWREAEAGGS